MDLTRKPRANAGSPVRSATWRPGPAHTRPRLQGAPSAQSVEPLLTGLLQRLDGLGRLISRRSRDWARGRTSPLACQEEPLLHPPLPAGSRARRGVQSRSQGSWSRTSNTTSSITSGWERLRARTRESLLITGVQACGAELIRANREQVRVDGLDRQNRGLELTQVVSQPRAPEPRERRLFVPCGPRLPGSIPETGGRRPRVGRPGCRSPGSGNRDERPSANGQDDLPTGVASGCQRLGGGRLGQVEGAHNLQGEAALPAQVGDLVECVVRPRPAT